MDNSADVLKEKSVHANKSEFFVFLPNELNQIPSDNRGIRRLIDANAAKQEGNIHFQNKRYGDAVRMYDEAIERLEKGEDVHSLELAVCYQNRSAAQMLMKNLDKSITDASKAIELNEHYAKAYYRRAMAYNEQRKYYRALQDVVQACILERFTNTTYNNMVGSLLTRIDSTPSDVQWKLAYFETEADELHCDHCQGNQVKFLINCGILEPLTVPIPNNQPRVGYIKAMVGLKEQNVDKIIAGCTEEETTKGTYLAESFILRAYMNAVAISSPSNISREYRKDLQRLNELIRNEKTPENIKFNALLCRANMYNRQQNFKDAQSELNALDKKHKNNRLVYIIKSGALMMLAHGKPEYLPMLSKCCLLNPNVFDLHMQLALSELANPAKAMSPMTNPFARFEQLIARFPNELEPRLCLAGMYAKLNDSQKAKKILRKAEKDFPNRKIEMSSVNGMLRPTHSSCVAYFKRSLEINKDDPSSLKGLLDYYNSTTHEYGKAIEVCTRALGSFLQVTDFQTIFELRHALLKRIVQQKYWNRL
ncbi:mitochondrial import receptor subunit TOM70-like [Bradysia coprophila]|uniref:mitochondrial import receptor subunit TOM70-like n=1 Tax=Bradysia coprophila TaxID=38358 RepID=UPI00187D7358|nr:mitochondrial import receptor subunit TOM70-like [Bradysia coprophila]